MANRKTEEERIHELELKMAQLAERKKLLEKRLREKERKARTRRLIQVGAIFESYFGFKDEGLTPENAEKIALALSSHVKENKEKYIKIDVDSSKKAGRVQYQIEEEKVIMDVEPEEIYKVEREENQDGEKDNS